MSRLLLKPLTETPHKPDPAKTGQTEQKAQVALESGPIQPAPAIVATPSKSADIEAILRHLPLEVRKDRQARLLFRKLGKSLDQKNSTLATQAAHLQALQAYTAEAKETKRQKVEREDPNRKFTRISDVRRTSMDMEDTIYVRG